MKDPYLKLTKCLERLYKEYKKHGRIVVAYDFDGTVYDHHNDGYTFPEVVELLRKVKPYAHLVVYSCSNEDRYSFIKHYLNKNNIPFDYIDETPKGVNLPQGEKMYYNILLDDRAGLIASVLILKDFIKMVENDKEVELI